MEERISLTPPSPVTLGSTVNISMRFLQAPVLSHSR